MLTVHTLPLCRGEENSRDNTVAKFIRGAENKALYGNWFGGRWLLNARMEHKFWPGEDDCPLVLIDQDAQSRVGNEGATVENTTEETTTAAGPSSAEEAPPELPPNQDIK